ncbi:amidase [Lophiostoma macrostomum CBS 122681]|uniref:Amidase n=1 Tax=Lophiostoma macrostomum CBS 122681 TaxID=1314788 RepID=A0A6A6SYN1_9PLEO|nr:amidase [Lophiostoma macrostomum CBS 122681]
MTTSTPSPKWQAIAQRKQEEQLARIPSEWLLKSRPSPDVRNYLDIPRTCGILTPEEIRITEEYDATSLAEAIRKRELKCIDVTRAFCKRAAIAHLLTTCLTEILFSDALTRATHLDTHLSSGNPPLGPLHGIPISLKDTFKIRGHDTSIGLASLCFNPSTTNAPLVDILLAAGAVLYCKTNVPQTLMALDSHNHVFGRVLNPINALCTAGGSTGGEGALLALRGSVLGVGTDVGGSIRVPAMCNGLIGLKPSAARVPYAGQENGTAEGMSSVGIKASAGPLARSVRDVELFFRAVGEREPWRWDPEVVPGEWEPLSVPRGRRVTVGVVRRDGVVEPHPPVLKVLDEVAGCLRRKGVEVVELDISPLFSKCQSLANALFGVDGGNTMFHLLEAGEEPLSPWLASRLRPKAALSLAKVGELQARRAELQTQFLRIWNDWQGNGKKIDAFICPVAPHPVPEIDRWNGVGYTSSFNLLDYPAGVLPVRHFEESDIQGEVEGEKPIGGWDKINRELWTDVDRKVYIGTPLSVQVVAPKLEERKLCEVMAVIDEAIHGRGKAFWSRL